MDIDNIECVSSSDGLEDDEIPSSHINHHHRHNHHNYPLKPQNNNHSIVGLVQGIGPATSVHELLECPVCTNSMYPPIHQVCFSFWVSFFLCFLVYMYVIVILCVCD